MKSALKEELYSAIDTIKSANTERARLGHAKQLLHEAGSFGPLTAQVDDQRAQADAESNDAYGRVRRIVNAMDVGSENWRRLMELVDGNGAWTAIDVVSNLSQDPRNETARRGVKIDPTRLKIRTGDIVDLYVDGSLKDEGWSVMFEFNWESWGSNADVYLVERNGVKVHPGMAQWEWDIINEAVPPKPELPTEPGTIFRVLEFDGEPFEALAFVDNDNFYGLISEPEWPDGRCYLARSQHRSVTKFELVDVVTKESA